MSMVRKTGKIVLVIGILMFITGMVLGFTVSTEATLILLWASIPVNALGFTLMRSGKRR